MKSRMESVHSTLPSNLLRLVNQLRDKGASSWLTAIPLVDQGLVLNKQEFRDSMSLSYNVPLSDLPCKCICSESIPSAMPCHAKRESSWPRNTIAFATYLPHFLVKFALTLKTNQNYNISIMSDSTSEAWWKVRREDWT